ncbi:cysteine desulfurase family protein [Stappia sp. MMSF_3263]|uniref:cysteine desulfurase family protein n=1 Tax=Stappia sp. MMSF_3263 TaxID=3046693 RepID=UPI00273E87C3|nr:cysteine desulfurase family protein [Stappia sp. MMSF_3263]
MQVGDTIYLDYQAATPLDDRVFQVMQAAYATHFANPHAADHVLGWRAAAAIEKASAQIATLFGLQADDVVFTSGASEANAMALNAAKAISAQTGRNKVLIGSADHGSIRNEADSSGLTVRHIPLDERGAPDTKRLRTMLSDDTALVSVVGVNNENGAIAELAEIATVCKTHSVLFHADLAQAPLALDIDLLDLDIPLATISAHKIYGPKGVGALLVGPGASEFVKPAVVGAGQQNGRRGGTMPTELIVGFGEACRLVLQNGESERTRVADIRSHFVQKLKEKQIATLVGDLNLRHPGNALMRFPGHSALDLLARLQPHIAASTQSACSSGTPEPSHVLRAMGHDKTFASECIRFSFGRFSDLNQADRAVALLLGAVADSLRERRPQTE